MALLGMARPVVEPRSDRTYSAFIKPTLNALSSIHQVKLFDKFSDVFQLSSEPSSGSATSSVKFSTRHLVSNICLTVCCRNTLFTDVTQFLKKAGL